MVRHHRCLEGGRLTDLIDCGEEPARGQDEEEEDCKLAFRLRADKKEEDFIFLA